MSGLSNFTRYIPPEFVAAANLSMLIAKIEEYERKVAELEAQLDNAKAIFDALSLIKENAIELLKDPSLEGLGAFLSVAQSQLESLKLQGEDNLTTTVEFQATLKNVARAKELHEDFTRLVQPIGTQTPFEKDLSADSSTTNSWGDIKVGFSTDSEAKYAINVLDNAASEALLGSPINTKDILINQNIEAELAVGGKASASLKALKLSLGAKGGVGIAMDTYYQIPSIKPTFKALWEMHRDAFKAWDLISVSAALSNSNSQGFRALKTKAQRTFSVWGEVSLGKTLVPTFNLSVPMNDEPIDIAPIADPVTDPIPLPIIDPIGEPRDDGNNNGTGDINGEVKLTLAAKASYKRKYSFEGNSSLFVRKNDEGHIVVKVEFDDETVRTSQAKASLKARFKGLDTLAQSYAAVILGEGNKLIKQLEVLSRPGQALVQKLVEQVDDDTWFKPFASLALGQSSSDDVSNELILNELQEVVDATLSPLVDEPEALARTFITQVLARFSIVVEPIVDNGQDDDASDDGDDSDDREDPRALSTPAALVPDPKLPDPKNPIEDPVKDPVNDEPIGDLSPEQAAVEFLVAQLSGVIAGEQIKVKAKIQSFVDEVKDAVKRDAKFLLSPLIALGEDVAATIANIDKDPRAVFTRALAQYQAVTVKLQSAIEKAEDTKLALEFSQEKKTQEAEKLGFEVVFKSQSASAQLLYQYLLLGIDDTADLLMQALEKQQEISVSARSLLLSSKLQRTSTQSFSFVGLGLFDSKAKSRKVDVSKLSLEVTAEGDLLIGNSVRVTDTETSNAAKRRASASLTYKFAQTAMSDKSRSAFSVTYLNSEDERFSPKQLKTLLNSFAYSDKQLASLRRALPVVFTSEQIASAVERYDSAYGDYTSSALSIKMRGGKKIYNALLSLKAEDTFEAAVDFLLAIYSTDDRKEYMVSAIQAFEQEARLAGEITSNTALPYRDFFEAVSTHPDRLTINPSKFLQEFIKRFENTASLDELLWEQAQSDLSSPSKNTFEGAMANLSQIGKDAHALSRLPSLLKAIDKLVSEFSERSDQEQLESLPELNSQLMRINEEVMDAISPWIDVDSVWKDFFEKLIGQNDINTRLVSFMLVLCSVFSAEHQNKALFKANIKLERDGTQSKGDDTPLLIVL